MKYSLVVGRFFGIPIKLHFTFLLLLIFIGISGASGGNIASGLYGMLVVIFVFLCVIFHEIGHSLVAEHYGIKVKSIILFPIGGVSQMEELPKNPVEEINISVVGPLVSLSLAGIFYLVLRGIYQEVTFALPSLTEGSILINLFWINLMLGLFNLIPAFPMDGGRILRGLLANRMEYLKATKIAVTVGQLFAILMFFFGIFFNWWLALIALFIYLGAEGEEQVTAMHIALRRIPVKKAMLTLVESISPDQTLGNVLGRICHGLQQDFPVVTEGKVIGLLTKEAIFNALHQASKEITVAEIMKNDFLSTSEEATLEDVYRQMKEGGVSLILVIQQGDLKGMISLEQIGKYHMLCSLMGRRVA